MTKRIVKHSQLKRCFFVVGILVCANLVDSMQNKLIVQYCKGKLRFCSFDSVRVGIFTEPICSVCFGLYPSSLHDFMTIIHKFAIFLPPRRIKRIKAYYPGKNINDYNIIMLGEEEIFDEYIKLII